MHLKISSEKYLNTPSGYADEPGPRKWYSQMGGKSSCLEMDVELKDSLSYAIQNLSEVQIMDVELMMTVHYEPWYASDPLGDALPERILDLSPSFPKTSDRRLFLNKDGTIKIKYRINALSSKHHGNNFVLKVAPAKPPSSDSSWRVNPVLSRPIKVLAADKALCRKLPPQLPRPAQEAAPFCGAVYGPPAPGPPVPPGQPESQGHPARARSDPEITPNTIPHGHHGRPEYEDDTQRAAKADPFNPQVALSVIRNWACLTDTVFKDSRWQVRMRTVSPCSVLPFSCTLTPPPHPPPLPIHTHSEPKLVSLVSRSCAHFRF